MQILEPRAERRATSSTNSESLCARIKRESGIIILIMIADYIGQHIHDYRLRIGSSNTTRELIMATSVLKMCTKCVSIGARVEGRIWERAALAAGHGIVIEGRV